MILWRTDENYPLIIIKYSPYLFHCLGVGAEMSFSQGRFRKQSQEAKKQQTWFFSSFIHKFYMYPADT